MNNGKRLAVFSLLSAFGLWVVDRAADRWLPEMEDSHFNDLVLGSAALIFAFSALYFIKKYLDLRFAEAAAERVRRREANHLAEDLPEPAVDLLRRIAAIGPKESFRDYKGRKGRVLEYQPEASRFVRILESRGLVRESWMESSLELTETGYELLAQQTDAMRSEPDR